MNIDEEDLPQTTISFIEKLKEKYEFDDSQAITHMVDLIEKHSMEKENSK